MAARGDRYLSLWRSANTKKSFPLRYFYEFYVFRCVSLFMLVDVLIFAD